jgi:uncharacterized protein (DUF1778 family)
MEADFSGYATKAGIKCSDGRTIMPDAFKHNDGMKVPLVWQHGHNDPGNVLGHAVLEHRSDGVYAYGYFNSTEAGQSAKALVQHGDITALSIYANQLVEKAKSVLHGAIREVSLVLSGANPGALIDNVSFAHSDGEIQTLEDEAIIYTGLTLEHENQDDEVVVVEEVAVEEADSDEETVNEAAKEVYDSLTDEQKEVVHFMIGAAIEHAGDAVDEDATVEDVYNSFTDAQKNVVHFMIGAALEAAQEVQQSDLSQSDLTKSEDAVSEDVTTEDSLTHQEGTEMTHNVFEQTDSQVPASRATLTHDQLSAIMSDAQKFGSFKDAFLQHAVTYGIENIDFLFPDATLLSNSPEMITRRQEWVSTFMAGVKKSPFSRIKTMSADLTLDDARAKGYVKASLKKEEWFALAKRTTTPTTIYKKQKLDRDDIIDITDLDVVAWLKAEMRIMLDEEIARACLVGDGREIDDDDKVDETAIRPIAFEDDFYAHKVTMAQTVTGDGIVDAIVGAREFYRGQGNPTMFCTEALLTSLLLIKDTTGRRLYPTQGELETACRVSRIVTVPVMETLQTNTGDLIAVLVNLNDYTVGANKGGQISMFDDFDIDYNQYKYLIETRMCGALTGFKTAVVISRSTLGALVTPAVPTFVAATGVVTIPATANVVYKMDGVTKTAGAQTAIASLSTVEVTAEPAANYYFPHNFDADWTFTRTT